MCRRYQETRVFVNTLRTELGGHYQWQWLKPIVTETFYREGK